MICRVLLALASGVLLSGLPSAALAGGGVGGGGVGGGFGGGIPAAQVSVDHTRPQNNQYAYLDYYPRNAIVHVGDSVNFTWYDELEPHTVTILPQGTPLTDQAVGRLFPASQNAVPSRSIPGALEQDFNTAVLPGCGNTLSYPNSGACPFTGKTPLNSGIFIPAHNIATPNASYPNPTFTVSMNVAPGTYHYFCLVHGPQMSGTITVLPAGQPIPGAVQNRQRANAQFQAANANALQAEASQPTYHTAPTGKGMNYIVPTEFDYGRVTQDQYRAPNLTIKAGDTVTWTPGFHTVTFPKGAMSTAVTVACVHGTGETLFNGTWTNCGDRRLLIYLKGAGPSGPPGQAYTGAFSNSGVLVIPRPRAWSLTFNTPGTYTYQCLIHKNMFGTVTVTK